MKRDIGFDMWRRVKIVVLLLFIVVGEGIARQQKVALVLSGGGAKGVAHVGVLNVLERVGIPVDIIVGTSMGSIVGGLYSIGYTARSLDSMMRVQDWDFLLSDKVYRYNLPFAEREQEDRYLFSYSFGPHNMPGQPVGFIRGQNVNNLFTDLTIGFHDSLDFRSFRIPFACVAADMMTRKEVVFDRGNLVLAMRASMAVPGVFTPVAVDSMMLVDGGVLNNFPVDVARAMGADIVIGVDVQAELMDAERLHSVSNVIPQMINLLCMNKYEENVKQTDLLIRPDLKEFSAASFTSQAIDTILKRGEEAALRQLPALLALKERLGRERIPSAVSLPPKDSLSIRHVFITGLSPRVEQYVRRKIRLRENERISLEDLQQTVATLYGTKRFSFVNYRLRGASPYDLELNLKEAPMHSVNVGFCFDSESMAALLINTTFNSSILHGSRVTLTGRLSENPYVRVEYAMENTFLHRFELAYQFQFNNMMVYERGEKKNSVTYRYHLAELGFEDLYWRNFKLQLGARYEYFDYNSFLFTNQSRHSKAIRPDGFFSYYGLARFESLDRLYYPSRGSAFRLDYALYTDNMLTYRGDAPFSAVSLNALTVLPISRRFCVLPSARGRVLIGENIP